MDGTPATLATDNAVLNLLPTELTEKFSHLTAEECFRARRVCKGLNEFVDNFMFVNVMLLNRDPPKWTLDGIEYGEGDLDGPMGRLIGNLASDLRAKQSALPPPERPVWMHQKRVTVIEMRSVDLRKGVLLEMLEKSRKLNTLWVYEFPGSSHPPGFCLLDLALLRQLTSVTELLLDAVVCNPNYLQMPGVRRLHLMSDIHQWPDFLQAFPSLERLGCDVHSIRTSTLPSVDQTASAVKELCLSESGLRLTKETSGKILRLFPGLQRLRLEALDASKAAAAWRVRRAHTPGIQ